MATRPQPACADAPKSVFFPDPDAPVRGYALRLCASCPRAAECLAEALADPSINEGIWSGIDFAFCPDDVKAARQALASGNAAAYVTAVRRARETTAAPSDGDPRRPPSPRSACQRCGAPIPAGRLPPDTNSEGAKCGKSSTYNRGCRCVPCLNAKVARKRPKGP